MNPILYLVMASLSFTAVTSHAATKHPTHQTVASNDSDLLFVPDDMADVDEADAPATAPVPVKKLVKPKIAKKPVAPAPEPGEAGTSEPVCTEGCPAPVSSPGPMAIVQAVRDLFKGSVDPLKLTGNNMSCAQERLLKVAKQRAHMVYKDRWSKGTCGTAVGDDIMSAGFKFAASGRDGVAYSNLLPQYGFKRTRARSEAEAPEGSIMVYAGPCSPKYRDWIATTFHEYCNPGRSKGETFGHVTVKGSPSRDHGKQWYYTDGRTPWAKNKDRRFFVGAYLPPGWEKGPCR